MGLPSVVPLTEAAAFTFGCAVLRGRWLDPDRVGSGLVGAAAILLAGLLVLLTPENLCIDVNALDPSGAWPSP